MSTLTQSFKATKSLSLLQFLSLIMASFLAATSAFALDLSAKLDALEITNLHFPAENIYASGQPSNESFTGIAEAGIQVVVNLRSQTEQDWSEQSLVESLGMRYINLPVAGVDGITLENARKLSDILAELEGKQVLIHCASGNRVGALRALNAYQLNGRNLDTAVEEGKAWGLTSLEPAVRELLAH